MSRLFESEKAPRPPSSSDAESKRAREALAAAELDESARQLGERLGAASSVTPIKYQRERRGKWLIEHGRAGDDYLFQLHPLKAPARSWDEIIANFIGAIGGVFPESLHKYYQRPDERWQINFYTVRLKDVCRLPGWESAINRAIDGLASVKIA
jgi:hypothetical protein